MKKGCGASNACMASYVFYSIHPLFGTFRSALKLASWQLGQRRVLTLDFLMAF